MRVLWTLYLTFAYLVYAIVLFLVVGFKNLGALEWTGIASGPLLIYLVRTASTTFFNYRIATLSTRLKAQQTERAKTIQKLKDATKYDSTLELLEKYGGPENKPAKGGKTGGGEDGPSPNQGPGAGTPNRTNRAPPPTANIPRDTIPPASAPGTPQPRLQGAVSSTPQRINEPSSGLEPSAEFAPNAFGPGGPPSFSNYDPAFASGNGGGGEPHWYDRILDLILGEDETAAKNRIVLICARCRLVNGQAPPGTQSLADVGIWKCMACGESNGEADEGRRIVEEVLGTKQKAAAEASSSDEAGAGAGDSSSDLVEVKREDGGSGSEADATEGKGEEDTGPAVRQLRSRAKKKGGK